MIKRFSLRVHGFNLITKFQVIIVLYSCWVGASKDSLTSSTGAGMLILAVILFSRYLMRKR